MKRSRPALVGGFALLALFLVACGSGSAGARGWAEPVSTGDLILVSTEAGRLDGIDSDDRRLVWSFPDFWSISLSSARDVDGIYQAPVLHSDGDTVFLAGYSGFLYAFRLSDALSSAEVSQGVPEPPAAALDFDDPIIAGIIVEEETDTIYVAAGNRLHAISASDFLRRLENPEATVLPRWPTPFEAGEDIWADLLDSGDRIYVASLDGTLYAVNKETGIPDWTVRTEGGLVSPPTIVGDLVVVGGFKGRLYALDLSDGSERWSFSASDWIWSRPRISGDSLIFGDFSGRLYSVAATTGNLEWSLDLARGAIVSSPILADGVLLVATEDGAIVGLDPSDRAVIWERKLDANITADLVLDRNAILVAPSGCVDQQGLDSKLYFFKLEPATGTLEPALDIDC